MSDETTAVNTAEQTAPASTTETKATAEQKHDDGSVPRHRLNESEEARRRAEAERDSAKQEADAVKARLSNLESLVRGGGDKDEISQEIANIEKRFNLEGTNFVNDILKLAEKKTHSTKSQIDPALANAAIEVQFNAEFDHLCDEIPDAESMTRAERKALKEKRLSKEFLNTPLTAVYRDMMFDKRATDSKETFESSRSGGKPKEDDAELDWANATPEQVREWDKKHLKHRRFR